MRLGGLRGESDPPPSAHPGQVLRDRHSGSPRRSSALGGGSRRHPGPRLASGGSAGLLIDRPARAATTRHGVRVTPTRSGPAPPVGARRCPRALVGSGRPLRRPGEGPGPPRGRRGGPQGLQLELEPRGLLDPRAVWERRPVRPARRSPAAADAPHRRVPLSRALRPRARPRAPRPGRSGHARGRAAAVGLAPPVYRAAERARPSSSGRRWPGTRSDRRGR